MWQEIITGIVVVALIGGILRYVIYRLGKIEERMVAKNTCEILYKGVVRDLKSGDEKFAIIMNTLSRQGELLASIDASFKIYREFMEKNCE
jgi:hypothetical protein